MSSAPRTVSTPAAPSPKSRSGGSVQTPPAANGGESVDPAKYVVPGLADEPAAAEGKKGRKRESAYSAPKAGGGKGFPIVIPIVAVIVIGLAAAWWFMLWSPSPAPVAKKWPTAFAAAMSGKPDDMKQLLSSGSQDMAAGFSMLGSTGLDIKVEVGDVTVEKTDATNATATVQTKQSVMGINNSDTSRIAMVLEGSFPRRQWKVDFEKTMQFQLEDAMGKLGAAFGDMMGDMKGFGAKGGKGFGKGMKSFGKGMKGMYGPK